MQRVYYSLAHLATIDERQAAVAGGRKEVGADRPFDVECVAVLPQPQHYILDNIFGVLERHPLTSIRTQLGIEPLKESPIRFPVATDNSLA
jgi:hypothetical protein